MEETKMIINLKQLEKRQMEESNYLRKLQKNRSKANKAKKAYWQKRIDNYFFKGIVK